MPIYEYACRACGHQFEEWQKISDKPIRTCPACKKRRVEKLVSMSSFQLKGGGWYADGYASSKSSSAEKATGSSTADGAKSKSDGSSGDSPTKKKASKKASSSSSSDTKAA